MQLDIGWHGGIRTFTDEQGIVWEVWEAHPQLEERRRGSERREASRAAAGGDRRSTSVDMRKKAADSAGWLVFRSVVGLRRRHPIPEGWVMFSNEELCRLLHAAGLTGPIPRQRLTG